MGAGAHAGERDAEQDPRERQYSDSRLGPGAPPRDVQGEQRAGGEEPTAERPLQGTRRPGCREEEVPGERQTVGMTPGHPVREQPGAEAGHHEVAEQRLGVRHLGREQDRCEVGAGERPDGESFDRVARGENDHHDGAGHEQEHANGAGDQPVRAGGCPQPEVSESASRADHRRAVAPQAGAHTRFPPDAHTDAGRDGEGRADRGGDPAAVDRVL